MLGLGMFGLATPQKNTSEQKTHNTDMKHIQYFAKLQHSKDNHFSTLLYNLTKM
jgi:hypothetical protein